MTATPTEAGSDPTLRIVFFGTPELAVPTLERLIAGRHEVVGVVSQPDRGRGRGRKTSPSPVSAVALREAIPLLRPASVGDASGVDALRDLEPDLGVVVAYGQFIPRKIRELPRLGMLINAHASLLPRYRGAAPIARAILGGETRTGISVMRVEREMDAGAVALVRELEIGPEENAAELGARLAVLAATAIDEALERIAGGRETWTDQDHAAATFAPKIEKSDAILDWSEAAQALARRVRALAPRPGAATSLDGDTLRILAAVVEPGDQVGGNYDDVPGSVRVFDDGRFRIATGDGWLLPTRVQRAGGKPMEIAAFLRGRPIPDGTILGTEP